MKFLRRIVTWLSDLRVAIVLLILIALSSAAGTSIPQGENTESYLDLYNNKPWLGLINGELLVLLQLNHVYSSTWFLALLSWLALSLVLCSIRRQLPTLKAAIKWIDYKDKKQLSKLAISQTIDAKDSKIIFQKLTVKLQESGWNIKQHTNRIAARKGVIGRFGPPLVHLGLIILMIGAVWGAIGGQSLERFLVPERSLDLLSQEGRKELQITLKNFQIDRDPAGRAEQFRSTVELLETGKETGDVQEISVNHPLRFKGVTIYQADWSLAAITIQINNSPILQLPLEKFPELGDEIWGIVIPTDQEESNPILISLTNEQGPAQVFNKEGNLLTTLRTGGDFKEVKGIKLRIIGVLPASGLLLKRDPGVPIVYIGFAITLIGSCLSILATKQLWLIRDLDEPLIYIGGICNRNLIGLAKELPKLLELESNN